VTNKEHFQNLLPNPEAVFRKPLMMVVFHNVSEVVYGNNFLNHKQFTESRLWHSEAGFRNFVRISTAHVSQ
jgi:hypothetical protein